MNTVARIVLVGLLLAGWPAAPAEAAGIVLDGQFGDWAGQANVGDVAGDAQNSHTDLMTLFFADNPGVETAYFMAERWQGGAQALTLNLYIDTNNDGDYSGSHDRRVLVEYNPNPSGRVDVNLYTGAGAWLKSVASNASWGEAGSTAQRVEWGVPLADLGLVAFQTIRLRLVSMQGNSVSDGVAEVQWSPANVLGWPLLSVAAVVGVAWLIDRRRRAAR